MLREAFILTDFSPEVRAYGVAVIALVLMFVVPAYGAVRKRLDGARLLQAVTVFFALNMLGFVGRRVLRHLHVVHLLRLGEHLRRDDRSPSSGRSPPTRST